MPLYYLCGPINGTTDRQANAWRNVWKRAVGPENCLDPMDRDYRGEEDDNVEAIVEGDLEDITKADIVIAHCWQESWGTAMEIYEAANQGKTVIAIVPEYQTRISPWLRHHATVVRSFSEALELCDVEVPA